MGKVVLYSHCLMIKGFKMASGKSYNFIQKLSNIILQFPRGYSIQASCVALWVSKTLWEFPQDVAQTQGIVFPFSLKQHIEWVENFRCTPFN
jgi:hypothetical protein